MNQTQYTKYLFRAEDLEWLAREVEEQVLLRDVPVAMRVRWYEALEAGAEEGGAVSAEVLCLLLLTDPQAQHVAAGDDLAALLERVDAVLARLLRVGEVGRDLAALALFSETLDEVFKPGDADPATCLVALVAATLVALRAKDRSDSQGLAVAFSGVSPQEHASAGECAAMVRELRQLLLSLFGDSELRIFLADRYGVAFLYDLPPEQAIFQEFAQRAAVKLCKHGLVPQPLVVALRVAFPGRVGDIDAFEVRFKGLQPSCPSS